MRKITKLKLPSNVLIGSRDYVITAGDKREKNAPLGRINYLNQTIELFTHLHPTNLFLVDTIIHEILHGIINGTRINRQLKFNSSQEEAIVDVLSTSLVSVLKTNKELRKFVFKGLED